MVRMFNYSAGGYSGVFMPEKVMKKIAKLNAKHSTEVRQVLEDHEGDLFAADWALTYPDGKQEVLRYAVRGEDVSRRIALFKAAAPEYLPDLVIVDSRDEALVLCIPDTSPIRTNEQEPK